MHAPCAVQHSKLYHTGTQLASRSLVVKTSRALLVNSAAVDHYTL